MKKTNLLLGSGNWRWGDEWCHIDANPASGADVIATIPPLPERVKLRFWSTILMSHFIEHLYPQDAQRLLMECYEVLEPGGKLIMEQPNLTYCCKIIAGVIDPPYGKSREQFGWWGVFGRPELDPLMGHKYGYTPESLSEFVVSVGFKPENITISPGRYHEPIRDFILEVVK